MNDDRQSEFGRKVARYLDRSADELRPGTLYRLRQARAAAMAGVVAGENVSAELALAGVRGGIWSRSGLRRPFGWLALVLLIAAGGFGYQQWHAMQQVREFEDLDLHLLASDLPIDAYLDRGFQNWLRAGFER
ncbi:MAG TPA: DUF3619 family protein [Casimicrobiaceae bacterium]|nr:DUF3619 family protein [Casimicrobiaceae bacterium]